MVPTPWRQTIKAALFGETRFRHSRRSKLQLTPLEDRVTPAGSLVTDLNTTSEDLGGYPGQLAEVNGVLYFVARDKTHGPELWKSDGTPAGTVMVKDINLMTSYGYYGAHELTNVNGTLFFAANDGIHGVELWKSDGTEAGTVMVKDINPSVYYAYPNSSIPHNFTNVNGTLFFVANDGPNGFELWKSDGTEAGTVLVKNIDPANYAYYGTGPSNLTNVNGVLYFSANDGTNGMELWKSDGSPGGTQLVSNINPYGYSGDGYGSDPTQLTNVNGTLYFTADDGVYGRELWTSDGTAGGTQLVLDIYLGSYGYFGAPYSLTNVNGTLFFSATDGVSGRELWSSDGTAAGTQMVSNINAYPYYGSYPSELTAVGSTLFFVANNGIAGRELWKSDGSAGGTVLIENINPSYYYAYGPHSLTDVNGTLYFTADDGTNGTELWKSDGSAAGTVLVKDINPTVYYGYGYSSNAYGLTSVNGELFLSATDGVHGPELWKSDGSAAGTTMVKDVFGGTADSYPNSLVSLNGTIYFSANDGISGYELWKTDGTAAGTVLVKDIFPGPNGGVFDLTLVNNTLFFATTDGSSGRELWKSDGTAAGTVLVKNIVSGAAGSYPSNLTAVGNALYFTALTSSGRELWKSDGSGAGTNMVQDIFAGGYSGDPRYLTDVGGELYFTANDGTNGRELWRSNGIVTTLVKDIRTGNYTSYPSNLTQFDGVLYFAANDGINGRELWSSDGTSGGTLLLKNIAGGSGGSYPYDLVESDGRLFLTAYTDATGRELWSTDGTSAGTTLVLDIMSGSYGASPFSLVDVNGTLFFSSLSAGTGNELWKSDGSAAGTVLVKDINPGSQGSSPFDLIDVDGTLFFSARTEASGQELWKSDGTAAGTVLDTDAAPGTGSSSPRQLTAGNNAVFFIATDEVHGLELWASIGSPTVSINEAAGQLDPALTGPILFTAVFSEPVTGFVAADVDLSASTAAGTLVATVTESGPMNGTTYTVSVTGMTNDGTVVATIAAGAAQNGSSELTLASTSTDNTVTFAVPPTVTIEQGATQVDPATGGPIVFDVVFSENVTSFTAADVDLSSSTVGGTLSKSVTQLTPSTYTVQVTGMFGAGTVVASIPAAVAQDGAGNSNLASTSVDNLVNYNGFGTVTLDAASYTTTEGGADIVVNVTRTGGTDGPITFDYAFTNVSASTSDYTLSDPASGSLGWLAGESDTESFIITVPADSLSEGAETVNIVLSNFTGSAVLGTTSAVITIAPSNPKTVNAQTKFVQTITEADGDIVTVKLSGDKDGSMEVYLTNDTEPISLIKFVDTDPTKAKATISVKKSKGGLDGFAELTQVTGTGLKSFSGKSVNLIGGGIDLGANYLGSLTLASIGGGADVKAGGTSLQKTKIKVGGTIGDGSDITLGSILSSLSATGYADTDAGVDITAPSIGNITIKGNFSADIDVSGAGVDHARQKKSLNKLTVKGIVDGSNINVIGNIGSVSTYDFLNSRLFGGYVGADDGTTAGGFNTAIKTTISSFKTAKNTKLGLTGKFQNSSVIADTIKTATLADVVTNNGGIDPFGVFADTTFKTVTVTIGGVKTKVKNGAAFTAVDDFDISLV